MNPTDTVQLRTVFQVDGDLSPLNELDFWSSVAIHPHFGARPSQLSDSILVDAENSTVEFTAVLDSSEFSGKDFYSVRLLFGDRTEIVDLTPEGLLLFEQHRLLREQLSAIAVQSASIHLESRDGSARFGLRIPEPATAWLIGIAAATGLAGPRRVFGPCRLRR